MQLTQTFLGWLNRVFDKDPKAFNAIMLLHAGGVMWNVSDETLYMTFPADEGEDFSVDLTQYTLGTLVAHLSGLNGLTVNAAPNMPTGTAAVCLIDGSGTQANFMQGYTSLLWVYMDAVAEQVNAAAIQVAAAPNEMSTTTADGEWLDFLGDFFDVPRNTGELDAAYGPRIISTTVRPLSNNVAIQIILTALTGYACTVPDVTEYGAATPAFDGTYTFNGAVDYNAAPAILYGLFDVVFTGTGLTGAAATALQTTVRMLVVTIRAAGTHLRNVTIGS